MTDWPENVRCHENSQFEPIYRRLVETAAGFLELIDREKRELPKFSGGHTASPQNQTAEEMWNQLEAALSVASSDAQPTNSERVRAFTFAVRGAYVIRSGAYRPTAPTPEGRAWNTTKGWAAFFTTLPKVKPTPAPAPSARPAGESMTVGEGDVATVSASDLMGPPASADDVR